MLPCWVISTQRSGTTYFCDLLNKTGLFTPVFDEYFNFHYGRGDISKDPNKYQYTKVQPEQWERSGLTTEQVQSIYPDLRVIRVYRDNLVDKAASLYLANKTNAWCVAESNDKLATIRSQTNFPWTASGREEYEKVSVPVDVAELRRTLDTVTRNERKVDEICSSFGEHMLVNYDDLVADPQAVLKNALSYLMSSFAERAVRLSPYTPTPERKEAREIKNLLEIL